MKKMMKTLAGVALASSLALGVQAASLKVAYDADPVSLDPYEQLSGGTLQMAHMSFDPLLRWSKDLSFEPRLAEKWERVDDLTMRFTLRKGVKFHSGNTLTSKDVKWTYDRLVNSADYKAVFSPFADLKVVDEYTFDIITKEPYPLLLNSATYIFPMDSQFYSGKDEKGRDKGLIKKHGDTFASRNISGTGPYVVSDRQQGVKLEYQRFDGYWDKKSPGNVDQITLTPIKENATRVAALLSGGVDFIFPVPPNDHARIERSAETDLITLTGTRLITMQLNQDRVEAFKDKRVRQAIVHAVNNEGIVKKIMKGFATAAGQQGPEGYAGYVEGLEPRYDLKKAKQLMKEAGYEDGFTITMMAPNNRYINDAKIAQAVASMLSRINIKVDLKTMPKAQYWPAFDERAADVMMIGWHADTEDSANLTEYLTACADSETGWGQYNSGNYCNEAIDGLVKAAGKETNPEKRAELLQQVERDLYEEAAYVPLHWQNLAWGARKGVNAEEIVNVMNFPYLGDLVVNEK